MSLITKVFDGIGDYGGLRAAEAWLKARGFSVGQEQSGHPIGVLLGEVTIGKWRSLSAEDITDLHGRLTTPTLSYRAGPVTLTMRPDAPSAVIEAFLSEVNA